MLPYTNRLRQLSVDGVKVQVYISDLMQYKVSSQPPFLLFDAVFLIRSMHFTDDTKSILYQSFVFNHLIW